ncbi:Mo-dependent nitrogenase C-terminal domain-containing protein [Limnoraphis robusta Tam1]|uniref:Mo-dependent nitrogenase C-terminal domain-containing protein n=1 Tax=Limnoraphis robusta TaxID=1118279 RepID=UPI002B1FC9C1|nr:Mo-dependent nitrogenase C-terminal domain-containing protein [Limnoraphis robusta]MEA5540104.1 Mo-dependent nitrogenase C-terminal domain-containing protein [Limnoraphis robusta Tam1]
MAITHPHQANTYSTPSSHAKPKLDLLAPLRRWVDLIEVKNANYAHIICRLIPCDCPFDRDIALFGRKLFHIPPLCELNPLYNEFVGLRFRALSYLADECGEDISQYIC